MSNFRTFVENYKKTEFYVVNELDDFSYPGDEPQLEGLIKTDEQLSREAREGLAFLYPYPDYSIYLFNGVKSVVLYHNIDTKTIQKSIFSLDIALKFLSEYKDVLKADNKAINEKIAARKAFNENMPKKPANSLEYDTKKELARLRKNVGFYYDRLSVLLTENVTKILGNNSPLGWENLGRTLPPHEKCQIDVVENTLKYIEQLAVYKKNN